MSDVINDVVRNLHKILRCSVLSDHMVTADVLSISQYSSATMLHLSILAF